MGQRPRPYRLQARLLFSAPGGLAGPPAWEPVGAGDRIVAERAGGTMPKLSTICTSKDIFPWPKSLAWEAQVLT